MKDKCPKCGFSGKMDTMEVETTKEVVNEATGEKTRVKKLEHCLQCPKCGDDSTKLLFG
jgi:predicted RNA-binding Zn-ribbon protein involved in translation (DUF1610 family)